MRTRAVNLRREKYDVYIGRAGKGQDGYFGNPYRVGYQCQRCGKFHLDAQSTLACYREYLVERTRNDQEFRRRALGLRGKALGCFCAPGPCHGNVLAEWIESECAHSGPVQPEKTNG